MIFLFYAFLDGVDLICSVMWFYKDWSAGDFVPLWPYADGLCHVVAEWKEEPSGPLAAVTGAMDGIRHLKWLMALVVASCT